MVYSKNVQQGEEIIMTIKTKTPKQVHWGKATYLATGIRTKAEALKVARKNRKFYDSKNRNIAIVPEISYGEKRPYSYTIVAE